MRRPDACVAPTDREDDVQLRPSASYSFTVRCKLANRPGMLGRLTSAIGDLGGDIGAIDIVSADQDQMVRDITVAARDEAHAGQIAERLTSLPDVEVVHVSDRTFLLHLGGKIEVHGKLPV